MTRFVALVCLTVSGLAISVSWAQAPAPSGDRDPYGGWTGLRFEATGFFQIAQRDGIWWLVTPEGNAFLSKGVNNVNFRSDDAPALGYSPYQRAVQEKYLAVPPRLDAERNRQILALRDQYVARLAALKKKLTVAGRIPDAVEANAEIERVATLPEVVEAEQENRPAGGPRPPGGASAGEAARARTTVLASGAKIYEATAPPDLPGLTFRPIPLQPTERARTLRTLSATAQLGKTGAESKASRERVSIYTADPSPKHILRVVLRAFNQGGAVEGGTLVTQYFIRPPGRATAKAVPALVAMAVVPLPRLDSQRTVTVDCPPVSLFLRTDPSPLYFRGIVATFYGTIVSVFDARRSLVFQAGSMLALDKLGVAEIPPNPKEEQRRRQAPGPAPDR